MRFFCFCLFLLIACSKGKVVDSLENEHLVKMSRLYEPIADPAKSDWLALHKEENQSFADFKNSNPSKVEAIEFIVVGELSQQDSSLLQKLGNYLALFYELEIEKTTQLPIEFLPDSLFGNNKIQSTSFLDFLQNETLVKKQAGVLTLVICQSDLQPFPKANSIFGQASRNKRLALVSLFQTGKMENGIPNHGLQELRGVKIVSHEVGHLLGLAHCQTFQCNMNGVNHLRELDSKPAYLCPNCLEKIGWRQKFEHPERFEKLDSFWTNRNRPLQTHYNSLKKSF